MENKAIKKARLQAYLGLYFDPPTKDLMEKLREIDPEGSNLIAANSSSGTRLLRQIVTYLLVKDGRKNYRILSSTQVIDIYLGKEDAISTYRDLQDQVIIVTVWKGEMENKRKWDLLYQLAIERMGMGKGLTIIAQQASVVEQKPFIDLGFTSLLDTHVGKSMKGGDEF